MENVKNQIANEVAGKPAENVITVDPKDVEVVDSKESNSADKKDKNKSFATNGGVGVETDDVAAKITVGTGDINKTQNEGSGNNISGGTVNITSNTDNTKNINKNRFNNLPSLPTESNAPQIGMEK